MNQKHFETLTKYKELIENYPQIRSCRDKTSTEIQELAEVANDLAGRPYNLFCDSCKDEMLMDLHNYYNSLKAHEKAVAKTAAKTEAKKANSQAGNKNTGTGK